MTENKKVKKPFYKRWWFWLIVVILVFGIFGSLGQDKNNTNKNDSSNKDSSSKVTGSKNKNSINKEKYNEIQMGQTKQDIEKELGKPSYSSNTTVNGVESGLQTYTDVSSSFKVSMVTVTLTDGKVSGKSYSKPILGKVDPIDSKKIDAIQTGDTYENVVKQLGDPATETQLNLAGVNSITIEYPTDKKGGAVSFTFNNNSLTTKTESHFNN